MTPPFNLCIVAELCPFGMQTAIDHTLSFTYCPLSGNDSIFQENNHYLVLHICWQAWDTVGHRIFHRDMILQSCRNKLPKPMSGVDCMATAIFLAHNSQLRDQFGFWAFMMGICKTFGQRKTLQLADSLMNSTDVCIGNSTCRRGTMVEC